MELVITYEENKLSCPTTKNILNEFLICSDYVIDNIDQENQT